MSDTATDTSVSVLEQIFDQSAEEAGIHHGCIHCEKAICGHKAQRRLPDWLQANCEVCIEMWNLGEFKLVRCKHCGKEPWGWKND